MLDATGKRLRPILQRAWHRCAKIIAKSPQERGELISGSAARGASVPIAWDRVSRDSINEMLFQAKGRTSVGNWIPQVEQGGRRRPGSGEIAGRGAPGCDRVPGSGRRVMTIGPP